MFKHFLFVFLLVTAAGNTLWAQGDFCKAITAITSDAPNKFRNIRGKLIAANSSATTWACGIAVPGTINSRFVASMGLFYEGAFVQTRNKEDIRAVYEQYKQMLTECLGAQGYRLSQQDNFYPGLADYKKLVYMLDLTEDAMPARPPAHIALEATYSKAVGFYTVVMYIFDH